ncbi:hypothetical protein V8G54_024938 [Vigna mungo]|uniref:Uncharacterized protein n=1 Tax=Vigna mungo TaxID=3915 RepID=A0AAQ3N7T5_VIGMU
MGKHLQFAIYGPFRPSEQQRVLPVSRVKNENRVLLQLVILLFRLWSMDTTEQGTKQLLRRSKEPIVAIQKHAPRTGYVKLYPNKVPSQNAKQPVSGYAKIVSEYPFLRKIFGNIDPDTRSLQCNMASKGCRFTSNFDKS